MLAEDLYNYILQMLRGSHESCKRIQLFQKPKKQFIIGSLADSSKSWGVGEVIGQNKIQTKSALRHNSMSVFFLLKKDSSDPLKITPSCSVFYRIFPTFEEQKQYLKTIEDSDLKKDPGFVIIYKRKDCVFDPIEAELQQEDYVLSFEGFITEILEDEQTYRSNREVNDVLNKKNLKNKFDPEWIENEETYKDVLSKITESTPQRIYKWEAQIRIEKEEYEKGFSDFIIVRMINTTSKKKRETEKFELFLFDCKVKIELNSNFIIPFEYNYKYQEFDYLEKGELRTLNCHADYRKEENTIVTKPYGFFEQNQKSPRIKINEVSADFKDLKSSLSSLESLLAELQKFYQDYTKNPIYIDTSHIYNKQYRKEASNFGSVITRFEEGLNLLKINENAKKAFFLMNRVFEHAMEYESWRLFQIVFIIMLIPEVVDVSKNRDSADIIHVDTGGGKSEAYFGLVVFTLFWDRLRGKDLGVSAITKFPLRMLSIQQLQRISKIIMIAENLRKEKGIEGEFSVGYYVGVSEQFPRHSYDRINKILKSKGEGKKMPGVLLDKCPSCSAPIYLEVDNTQRRIYHKCDSCERSYSLFFTNSEIYRFIPSFIVSTVDKLASVALNRRFKNLLGGKLSSCSEGHGFVPRNDKCEVKTSPMKSCDKEVISYPTQMEGPTLMIQDELHLLREGFGTINSHFESLLNTLLQKLSNKKFKYISMTATVSGAKEQIDHLYGKDYFIFPGPVPRGLSNDSDFFFEYPKTTEGKNIIQRKLIGLKPNLRDNQYASLLTIYHLTIFIKLVKHNLDEFALKYSWTTSQLQTELKKYQCLLTYHGKKADVFGMSYFLHTVVTSKLEDFEIINKPLTGGNTLAEIKDVITQIEDFPEVSENSNKLHATFATSVVSHGVDINNWNIMIFQGMTRDTAEYIQALSRVGRRYLGIIFLWYYPNRVRDLSYYKNFSLYHRILQHKVEKTPISRWAKLGFKQTFTSLFCAAILNYISNEVEKPLYTLDAVNSHFDSTRNRQQLVEFLKEAYYTHTHMDKVGAQWFRDNIGDETERRLNKLKETIRSSQKNFFPNVLKECGDPYFRTQYGMRGIQDQITLRLDDDFSNLIKKYDGGG